MAGGLGRNWIRWTLLGLGGALAPAAVTVTPSESRVWPGWPIVVRVDDGQGAPRPWSWVMT